MQFGITSKTELKHYKILLRVHENMSTCSLAQFGKGVLAAAVGGEFERVFKYKSET